MTYIVEDNFIEGYDVNVRKRHNVIKNGPQSFENNELFAAALNHLINRINAVEKSKAQLDDLYSELSSVLLR